MIWQETLFVTVTSGVVVPTILALARYAWTRRRVPTALPRSVKRKRYLRTVLQESLRSDVTSLDVIAPRLTPAGSDETIRRIQDAWQGIMARGGRVRVVTLDSEDCLRGAVELSDSIEIRVARRELGSEELSYHLFMREPDSWTVFVNHHQEHKDLPVRLGSDALAQILGERFDAAWEQARPLESLLAKRFARSSIANKSFPMNGLVRDRVLAHLAFQARCSVVFLVGLPGAGKSTVRRQLAERLRRIDIDVREMSDYVYAYRDFLHGRVHLPPPRGEGFEPQTGGAFLIRDESALQGALQALAQAVSKSAEEHQVTLVEFARTNLAQALQEFDGLEDKAHVIYIEAPMSVRAERLKRRAEPPELVVDGQHVKVVVSDNHALPSGVNESLYRGDQVDQLCRSPRWRDRVFRIDNDRDDDGALIANGLRAFVEKVVNESPGDGALVRDAQPRALSYRS